MSLPLIKVDNVPVETKCGICLDTPNKPQTQQWVGHEFSVKNTKGKTIEKVVHLSHEKCMKDYYTQGEKGDECSLCHKKLDFTPITSQKEKIVNRAKKLFDRVKNPLKNAALVGLATGTGAIGAGATAAAGMVAGAAGATMGAINIVAPGPAIIAQILGAEAVGLATGNGLGSGALTGLAATGAAIMAGSIIGPRIVSIVSYTFGSSNSSVLGSGAKAKAGAVSIALAATAAVAGNAGGALAINTTGLVLGGAVIPILISNFGSIIELKLPALQSRPKLQALVPIAGAAVNGVALGVVGVGLKALVEKVAVLAGPTVKGSLTGITILQGFIGAAQGIAMGEAQVRGVIQAEGQQLDAQLNELPEQGLIEAELVEAQADLNRQIERLGAAEENSEKLIGLQRKMLEAMKIVAVGSAIACIA